MSDTICLDTNNLSASIQWREKDYKLLFPVTILVERKFRSCKNGKPMHGKRLCVLNTYSQQVKEHNKPQSKLKHLAIKVRFL